MQSRRLGEVDFVNQNLTKSGQVNTMPQDLVVKLDLTGANYFNQSEDCLFLNIDLPRQISSSEPLPVMVFIHGGGLSVGTAHDFMGTRLSVDGNVIVVSINYRLGIFGFLSLYHPAATGNYGLWDQKMALQWVHDNIASFGGNPNSVTIYSLNL